MSLTQLDSPPRTEPFLTVENAMKNGMNMPLGAATSQMTEGPPRSIVMPLWETPSGAAQSAVSVVLTANDPHGAIACAVPTCTTPAHIAASAATTSSRFIRSPLSLADAGLIRRAEQGVEPDVRIAVRVVVLHVPDEVGIRPVDKHSVVVGGVVDPDADIVPIRLVKHRDRPRRAVGEVEPDRVEERLALLDNSVTGADDDSFVGVQEAPAPSDRIAGAHEELRPVVAVRRERTLANRVVIAEHDHAAVVVEVSCYQERSEE